ncbi:hypothetical protein [Sulfurimonas sp. HSL3-7]|uniref:hypothetical protein n=1 Tax=Sulfonitrofixus jiaomeiensis TaxID=3131938 RepID=UPI0031F9DFF8
MIDLVNFEYFNFQITPKEYLKFAKEDLKDNSNRALINALSNAKRSIDCLIESTLKGLSINIENNISPEALNFCNKVLNGKDKGIMPNTLKLFNALGLAPSILITEVRFLRNVIEHEYKLPKREDVIRAIEVADLLINSVESKKIKSCELLITDKSYNKGILFDLSYESNRFNLNSVEMPDATHLSRKSSYSFHGDELIYYYFLRAMIIAEQDEDELFEVIKLLISEIKPTLSIKHIKCKMH